MMKQGVVIINCARGGIVDEEALHKGLVSKKVRAAALDVFEKEPPFGSPLLSDENCIFVPHLGASTKEAQKSVGIEIANQMKEALTYHRRDAQYCQPSLHRPADDENSLSIHQVIRIPWKIICSTDSRHYTWRKQDKHRQPAISPNRKG